MFSIEALIYNLAIGIANTIFSIICFFIAFLLVLTSSQSVNINYSNIIDPEDYVFTHRRKKVEYLNDELNPEIELVMLSNEMSYSYKTLSLLLRLFLIIWITSYWLISFKLILTKS
ncbi:MAG: hypothetical protein SFU98_08975 [Leptospiraceae bacterium]|nr:hypothetical protein [Leptospiraceae bacterium]